MARGVALNDEWASGPQTYLSAIAGFPNLFIVTGPGSPSVVSNMMVSLEQHVEWIADCLSCLEKNNIAVIEPTADAQSKWTDHVPEVAAATLYPKANSWYMGVNVPGKPRVCMPYVGGVGHYKKFCDEIATKGYEGFIMSRNV